MDEKEKRRVWERKQTEDLTDWYIKKALRSTYGMTTKDITPDLIERKREYILMRRALIKLKKAVKAA